MPEILQLDDLVAEIKANRDPIDYELMQLHQDRLIYFYSVMVKDPAVPPRDLEWIRNAINAMEGSLFGASYREMKRKGDELADKWEADFLKAIQAKINEQLLYDLPQDDPGH